MRNIFQYSIVFVTLLFIVLVSIYTYDALESAKTDTYNDMSKNLLSDLKQEETLLENIGMVIVLHVADNKVIKQALIEHNRNMAIKELSKISSEYKKSTSIKNLKIHIHTADVKAFVRNWKLDKYGDDLSSFRKTIIQVKKTRQPLFAFEIGRIGLTLRSILPIMEGNEYLGSVEFIQAFENITNKFENRNNSYLLLMNKALLKIAKYRVGSPVIGEYVLISKSYDEEFFKKAKELDLDTLKKQGYLLDDKYFYTYKLIIGLDNDELGMHFLGMPTKEVNEIVESKQKEVAIFVGLAILLYFSILFILMFLIPDCKKEKCK